MTGKNSTNPLLTSFSRQPGSRAIPVAGGRKPGATLPLRTGSVRSRRHPARISGWLLLAWMTCWLAACSIAYKFNGASIDYTTTKTITIQDFPNQAPLVYPMFATKFTTGLQDIYLRQTRLTLVPDNGDLAIEGEITGYDLTPAAVSEDMIASRTKLTITVRVRYSNRNKPEEDFEQSFSAYRDFDNSQPFLNVQDELETQIIEELADQIYNATVANW